LNPYEHLLIRYGYAGIFLGLVLGIVGLPIPDETLLAISGYLAYRGDFRLFPTCAVAFLGSACGITLSYILGRVVGIRLDGRLGRILHLDANTLERVHAWFARGGKWLLLFGYFIPGVRHLTAIVAGSTKLEAPAFALFAYSGALLWSLTFISIGYRFGGEWSRVFRAISDHRLLVLAVAAAGLIVWLAIHLRTRRAGKRELPPGG
jgi:membrane protein DedA with SNARE-associated domain